MVFDRSLGRPRNAVVLPSGWYCTESAEPATVTQLQAIHVFSEELSLLIGTISLYNEALGTTSNVYNYDRVKGRE